MLVLTRRRRESIIIGGNVKVTVLEVGKEQVKLGIEAPRQVPVYREEVWQAVAEANREAAGVFPGVLSGLMQLMQEKTAKNSSEGEEDEDN